MPIYALLSAAVFVSGYGACWSTMTKQIAILESQIELSNTESAALLQKAVSATNSAESDASLALMQLENANAKSIKLNTDLHNSLTTVRMRDPGKRSVCTDSLPKSNDTPIIANASDTSDISAESSRFLQSEAYRADALAIYASACHQFVLSNCGIKQ